MEILRAASVVAAHDVRVGDRLPLLLPELGFDDEAEVLSITPSAEPVRLDVPVVTGRFVTTGSEIVRLWLEGQEEPIGATPLHPLFSADRRTWVPAGEVRRGERLVTLRGIAIVRCVEAVAEPETVYNVEVSQQHTYFVSAAGVWAHNPCKLAPNITPRRGASNAAVQRPGDDMVYVAGNHGMAMDLLKGGTGLQWIRPQKVWRGFVEWLDDAGKNFRFIREEYIP